VDGAVALSAGRTGLARGAGRVAMNLIFLLMLACAGIMLVPAALGFHRYVILTGSMTGTYDAGSIVYDRPVPTSSLKVGDPITYNPPPGYTEQKRVTHRIYKITQGPSGQRVFQTKGDANKAPDIWRFILSRPTQDRVFFHVPYVGLLFELLSLRNFRIVLIGLPAVVIALFMMRGLWREAGEEERRQKLAELGWQEVAGGALDEPLPALPGVIGIPRPVIVRLAGLRATPRTVSPVGVDGPAQRARFDFSAGLIVRRIEPRAVRCPPVGTPQRARRIRV
jgi:signal peptidase